MSEAMAHELWDKVNKGAEISTLLLRYGTTLSNNGRRGTPCPLCGYSDKTRPALQIFPAENSCYCHHCKKRLDIFELVKKEERLDNRWEALLFLAQELGLSDDLSPAIRAEMERRDCLSAALEEFADHFNHSMGPEAISYLRDRKIDDEFVTAQKIVFIPWKATFFPSTSAAQECLKEIGLLSDDWKVNPAWCNRIFVPFWKNGRIFYFAGRSIDANSPYPQMLPANSKMKLNAKPVLGTPIGEHALVVEGLFDFLMASQHQDSVLGILGQSPIFDLPKHVEKVSLCFDWDREGEQYIVKFGLHFQAQKKEVFVITRPEGLPADKKDLNDYVCAGGLIDHLRSIPLMDYLIGKLTTDRKSNLPIVFNAITQLGPIDKEEAFRKMATVTNHKVKTLKDEFSQNFTSKDDEEHSENAERGPGTYESGTITYRIPLNYQFEPEGIYVWNGNHRELITSQTIIINGIGYDNLENRLHVLLQYGRNGELKAQIYRKLQIASSGELLKLADDGLDVNSSNSHKLVRYLADFYNENEDLFPRIQIVSQLGWSDELFNLPNNTISSKGTDSVYFFENEIRKSGYLKRGSLEGWLQVVHDLKILKDPRIMFFLLFAGFAGAILKKIGGKTTIFHIFGDTSIGKTSALMLPASIYGRPATDGIMQRWYATKNFIARVLEQLNNVPLFLDELSVVRDADVQDLAYVVESQKAKGKASSTNPLKTVPQRNWCTTIFSTGEPSILSDHSLGGAAVRIIEFSGNPFKEDNRPLVERLRKGLMDNYGHALEPFLQAFFSFDWSRVEFFWDEGELTRVEHRMADIFQAIYIAGVLVEQVFQLGVDPKDIVRSVFKEVKKERANEGDFISRFISFLTDQLSANRSSFRDAFNGRNNNLDDYRTAENGFKTNILGYVFKETYDAEDFDLGIIKSEFNSLVKVWGAGPTSRTLLVELRRRNWITCEKDNIRLRKRVDGELKPLIYFPNFNHLGEKV